MKVDPQALADQAKSSGHLLLIMRHAQAEPCGAGGDRSRPLSLQGRKQAETVGRSLSALGLIPDRIACSGALRARQTLDLMLSSFGDGPSVDYRESLYTGGTQGLLDELVASKQEERFLLIVTHEPSVSYCAQLFADPASDQGALGLLGLGMPPACAAVLAAAQPLRDWSPSTADLLGTVGPNDLRKYPV
ncbi:phosphoglycerate mutase family protein [Bifidobacterium actinocoloniiforme DSM 22766]|uniref:Phosphoglycerate mutase family protein n=1 Tax=Bifidobacterium actinocoloniiforme DSM 22766 TaxID=1437605 RepID=A0A086Z0L1_9BIFI|nr:histidine phosphatase family protein [Bifidobacterium actinocoloniiforme]AKV55279.1 hypothetical protein AB656_02420 [Bifidobacterium actinocoloniiforme DSM 22766]KFI40061.1 phosphoglycerate mutase family protein [Bifidobacterium actinocoloniiforme DSM 22766]